MPRHSKVKAHCPMDAVLRILSEGPLRFGALKTLVPDISSKVLTERLRHLEASGLVHRDYRPTIPPAVTYSLTSRGVELRDVLDRIGVIAQRWQQEDTPALDSAAVAAE